MNRTPEIVAEYIDVYGDTRAVHKTRHGLKLKRQISTAPLALNRMAGPLVGMKIRVARQAAGLSLAELCVRAGIASATPKSRMYEIEMGKRPEGIRLGTLYALAIALNVPIQTLLPSVDEVAAASGAGLQNREAVAI